MPARKIAKAGSGGRASVASKAAAAPAPGTLSSVEMMLQRLDGLYQRLSKESKDRDELLALSEAIRIVRSYFGK